jgi:hypothetical protein
LGPSANSELAIWKPPSISTGLSGSASAAACSSVIPNVPESASYVT